MYLCFLAWNNHPSFKLLHFDDGCGKAQLYASDTIGSRILNGANSSTASLPWMAFVYMTHGEYKMKRDRTQHTDVSDANFNSIRIC